MILVLGLGILAIAIFAVLRGADVRLALGLAAIILGVLGGDLASIPRTFLVTLADEKFVVPICCAMGFAHVLRLTQCDQHLVHLLVKPLEKARFVLIPGTILVGFVVNIPIISQTSTAVTIGPVLIPLLLTARLSPVAVGASLLLGASVGGELLNPGAPELRTTVEVCNKAIDSLEKSKKPAEEQPKKIATVTSHDCVQRILPLVLIQLVVSAAIFWFFIYRHEKNRGIHSNTMDAELLTPTDSAFQISYFKAIVPLVPLLILFLTARPFEVISVPKDWLLVDPNSRVEQQRFDSRLIGAAMLIGVVVAAFSARRTIPGVAQAFFDGAGYAFTHIISLIVIATCLGQGIRLIGLAQLIGDFAKEIPSLLVAAAGILPCGFATLCGSGMAATQSLFGFFADPALQLNVDPAHVGAVVSIAGACGRTMSPVAAVTLMCAAMTKTNPVDLVKRLALPLLIALAVTIIVASLMASYTPVVYIE